MAGYGPRAPSATTPHGRAVLMWSATSSCCILLGGIFVFGRVAGQGKEHLVEARLAEREVDEGDARAGQLRESVCDALGVGDSCRERRRVGLEVHRYSERPGEHPLGVGPIFGIAQPYVEGARANRGLELVGGALGDDFAAVDDGDPVGELIGLIEVLRGQEHRRTTRDQRPDDVPYLVAAARVEAGSRLAEKHWVWSDHYGGRDVEPATHATGVFFSLPVGCLSQTEGVEQLAGPHSGVFARVAQQPGDKEEVL